MIRVFFDTAIFRAKPNGGVARYFTDLARGLTEHRMATVVFFERSSAEELSRDRLPGMIWREPIGRLRGLDRFGGRWGRRLNDAVAWKRRQWAWHAARPVVYHSTLYRPAPETARAVPEVCTVYDLMHETRDDLDDPSGDAYIKAKADAMRRSRAVVSISDATRDRILERFDIPADRVITVPLAVSEFWRLPEPEESPERTEPQFLLYVGTRDGYKNWRFVVECLARVPEMADLTLVCAGADFTDEERRLLAALQVEHRVRSAPWPTDLTLRQLYWNAAALVFPSREEGFGLPTIEALACGCPVVLSDIDVFRETAGGIGLFFPPDDPDRLASACVRAVDRRHEPDETQRRKDHAARYSIQRMAQATAAVYEMVTRK
jgi:glycosyltransferase involved in cell wall biosynthesis